MTGEPLNVPAGMVGGLDVVSIQGQPYVDGDRVRRNVAIAELDVDDATGDLARRTVFERDPARDAHVPVAESRVLREIATERGRDDAELRRRIAARERVLRGLLQSGGADDVRVGAAIRAFASNPGAVLADPDVEEGLTVDADGRPVATDSVVRARP